MQALTGAKDAAQEAAEGAVDAVQDAAENAKLLLAVLSGEDHGARRAAAVENAASAILAAGKADTALEAIDAARASIDSGRALAKLKAMVAFK